MALTLKGVRSNALMLSASVEKRQRGQRLALEQCEQTKYLVEKITRCTPNQPCNTSACDFCGCRFPRHKNALNRDSELRYRPKSKAHQLYNEHPDIWTAAPTKLNKYAPRAAAQLLTNFESQFWLEHVQHFTINATIIPFDHTDLKFALGDHRTDLNCLSAEVRDAIYKSKPKIREIFYYLDDAPFYGIFENTIIELDGHPLWKSEKRKWAEVRSGCKYGILVHIHGVFANVRKEALKKACSRFGYGGNRQTAIGKLRDEYEEKAYQKGGIRGWGEYIQKNEFKSDFGNDTNCLYVIHEHVRKQVGRRLIRHHHKSYKPYPIVRTWECLDPKDYEIFDEMHQDYLEHHVYALLSDEDYEAEHCEPTYEEIFPERIQCNVCYQSDYQNRENHSLAETVQDIDYKYFDYLEYEYGISSSRKSLSGADELDSSPFFDTIQWVKELTLLLHRTCINNLHYYSNSCFQTLAVIKGSGTKICREAHFWVLKFLILNLLPAFHKRE